MNKHKKNELVCIKQNKYLTTVYGKINEWLLHTSSVLEEVSDKNIYNPKNMKNSVF